MALSLLSPFLYLKTVASVLATLYNSGQCEVSERFQAKSEDVSAVVARR